MTQERLSDNAFWRQQSEVLFNVFPDVIALDTDHPNRETMLEEQAQQLAEVNRRITEAVQSREREEGGSSVGMLTFMALQSVYSGAFQRMKEHCGVSPETTSVRPGAQKMPGSVSDGLPKYLEFKRKLTMVCAFAKRDDAPPSMETAALQMLMKTLHEKTRSP
jgi:hypothetical protein